VACWLTETGTPLSFIVVPRRLNLADDPAERPQNRTAPNRDDSLVEQQVDWSEFLAAIGALRRGYQIIAIAAIAGLIVGILIAFLIPSEYTSIASFIPPSASNTSGAAALAGQLSQLSGLGAGSILGGMKSPGDLYVGILRSRSVQSDLVKRFDLQNVYKVRKESRAEKKLGDHSKFEVDTKTSIVTLSVTDRSPSRARDLTNAYLDALRQTNGRLALSESSQRRLFFEQQLEREKNDLEDAEVALKKTEEQSGLIAPVGQTAMEIETVAQTRAQISIRQVELSALRQSATDQNPSVVRLESEITDLQAQLSRLGRSSDKNVDAAIPTSKVPELQLEYVRKEREVKYHEALFAMLSRQYEAARIDEARDSPLLQVLDPASYPDVISFPPRLLIGLAGMVLGALIGGILVLTRDHFAFRDGIA
jgi:tyrosine-protein kinase Etk/Wzc